MADKELTWAYLCWDIINIQL